ncbi:MAG TPA: hypothetical protein VFZ97_12655 [Acidimicrobiales bacterium]
MHSRIVKILTTLAGVLAVGEFVSAVIIAVENYRGSFALGGVVFGLLFLVGVWLLCSRRVTAGTVYIGILCLFEVVQFPGWARHNALDWAFQTIYALIALGGLATAVAVLVTRRRSSAVTI